MPIRAPKAKKCLPKQDLSTCLHREVSVEQLCVKYIPIADCTLNSLVDNWKFKVSINIRAKSRFHCPISILNKIIFILWELPE